MISLTYRIPPMELISLPSHRQLPLWYELWWDNGVFPGQPACDFMWGPLSANLTEVSITRNLFNILASLSSGLAILIFAQHHELQTFYAKAWFGFACVMGLPLAYLFATTDEFTQPMVRNGAHVFPACTIIMHLACTGSCTVPARG